MAGWRMDPGWNPKLKKESESSRSDGKPSRSLTHCPRPGWSDHCRQQHADATRCRDVQRRRDSRGVRCPSHCFEGGALPPEPRINIPGGFVCLCALISSSGGRAGGAGCEEDRGGAGDSGPAAEDKGGDSGRGPGAEEGGGGGGGSCGPEERGNAEEAERNVREEEAEEEGPLNGRGVDGRIIGGVGVAPPDDSKGG